MGRPWWHDGYWEKEKKRRPGFTLPGRSLSVWAATVVVALLLTAGRFNFRFSVIPWLSGFVYYECSILTFAIIIQAMMSWFTVSRDNMFAKLLDSLTGPMLSPLRRIVPRLGMIDITPLIAIVLLNIIPVLFNYLLP